MRLLFLVLSIFYMNSAYPQVNFEWVKLYNGGLGKDGGNEIITDDSGNVYICGYTKGSFSRQDMILLKYNSKGTNVFISIFSDTISPDFDNYNSAGDFLLNESSKIILAGTRIWKYSRDGKYIWDLFPGPRRGYGRIFLDKNFNFLTSTEFANSSFLIRKYSYEGDSLWNRTFKPAGIIYAKWRDAGKDSEDNIITTGYMNKTGIGDKYDYMTVKYSGKGDLLWYKRFDETDDNICLAMSVDKSDNIYVTGTVNYNNANIMTIKYSPEGDTIWKREFEGGNWEIGTDIEVDDSGNVYVCGFATGLGVILIKYDSNGNFVWQRNQTGNAYSPYPLLRLDKDYNPYFAFAKTTSSGGEKYAIAKYDNSGNFQWLAEYTTSNLSISNIYDFTIDNEYNIYATGSNSANDGDILTVKWSQIITNINNSPKEIPEEYFLSQNYPNPFNPTTTINFSIPDQQFVKITVFDLSGKEIKTLVNELKPAGNYDVTFFGTGDNEKLSSGVYFYRLETQDYSETKRMILIK